MESGKKKNRAFADWLELATEVMEIVVAIIVLIGFILGIIPLLKDMPALLNNTNDYSFHTFLEHAFNLVIGIEFVRMLIRHTPGSALDVLLFAIARHLVLGGETGLDLCLGVLAIAGIFAIRKFLFTGSFESRGDESSYTWIKTGEDKAHDREREEKVPHDTGSKDT